MSKPSPMWPYTHKMLLMFISIFFLAFKGWLNAKQDPKLNLNPRFFSLCLWGAQSDTQNSDSFQFPETVKAQTEILAEQGTLPWK